MQYTQESPQDYYDRTGQMPPPVNPNDPSFNGGNVLVDGQGRPYIGGVSQSGPFYMVDAQHADASHPVGTLLTPQQALSSVYPDQSNNGQESGFGDFAKMAVSTLGPAVGFGAYAGLAGAGAAGADAGAAGLAGDESAGLSMAPASYGGATAGAGGAGGAGVGALDESAGLNTAANAASASGPDAMMPTVTNPVPGAANSASGAANPNTTFGIPNNVLGGVAQGVLGLAGANAQGNAYQDVANQYLNIGAPYRGQLAASYQPGFDLMSQPGYGDAFNRSADIAARSYSAKMGNPADNPTAQAGILNDVWSQNYLPALNNYRGQLGQFGGLGLNTSGTASLGGATSTGDAYNAIGAGLNTALNPPTDIASLLKQLGTGGTQNYTNTVGGMKA